MLRIRYWTYFLLEGGSHNPMVFALVDLPLVGLILANVIAATLETVPSLHAAHADAFLLFEQISLAIFVVEYMLRLWASVENPGLARLGRARGRLRFALSPYAIIDLLAILPAFLVMLVPGADLRILRIFRLLRLLKLARYSPALSTLGRVLVEERRALFATLMIMAALLLISSTAMYYAERHIQPEKMGSIPDALWWSLATLTTVGYGDVTPVTPIGKVIGGVMMIFGLGLFALPIGILASGFSNEIHRQHFVVSWSMVANQPLFKHLEADHLAWISNRLQAREVSANTVLFHEGDPPDEMYFIASGKVSIDLGDDIQRQLKAGDFFGEMGIFYSRPRMATVKTLTRSKLMILDADDFHELLRAHPSVRTAIEETAKTRTADLTNM